MRLNRSTRPHGVSMTSRSARSARLPAIILWCVGSRLAGPQSIALAHRKRIFSNRCFAIPLKEFVQTLKTAAGSGGNCDFYLVIFRQRSGYGNTNQYLNGIGFLNHDTGIFSSQYLFAILSVSLYDGKTSELRKTELLRTGPALDIGEALTGPGIHGLYRRVDKTWLPNPPQAAAQNQKLRDATWSLIEPGLANTIPAMLAPQ
jgi:hypothetical protein